MKTFSLYKRSGHRDAPWYFSFTYKNKRYPRCLETPDKAEARRRARLRYAEIVAAVQADDYPTLDRLKLRAATTAQVAALVAAYRTAPVDAGAATRTTNINALQQLLTAAHPAADPLHQSIAAVNAALSRAWFAAASARALAEPDQAAATTIKRSANSRFAQAASMFTRRALDWYKQHHVHHASYAEFVAAGQLHEFTRLPAPAYNPPSDAIISATLDAWQRLDDRNHFLAMGLMLAFGLRKGEVSQAKWSWWTTRAGYPVLEGGARVKSGAGCLQVRALDPWFTILRQRIDARGWRGAPDDYILTGTPTARSEEIFRGTSAWLRALGWGTQKTNHALRAYAGSQVAMKYGIYEAQMWLRHSTVAVTESHYSHFVKGFKPADLDTLPARWATAPTAGPDLRIVQTA